MRRVKQISSMPIARTLEQLALEIRNDKLELLAARRAFLPTCDDAAIAADIRRQIAVLEAELETL